MKEEFTIRNFFLGLFRTLTTMIGTLGGFGGAMIIGDSFLRGLAILLGGLVFLGLGLIKADISSTFGKINLWTRIVFACILIAVAIGRVL